MEFQVHLFLGQIIKKRGVSWFPRKIGDTHINYYFFHSFHFISFHLFVSFIHWYIKTVNLIQVKKSHFYITLLYLIILLIFSLLLLLITFNFAFNLIISLFSDNFGFSFEICLVDEINIESFFWSIESWKIGYKNGLLLAKVTKTY